MSKDKDKEVAVDLYVGADPMDDDLSDMEYIQNEETVSIDTHPPETEEEANLRDEMTPEDDEKAEDDEKVEKAEDEGEGDDVETEEEEETAETEEEPEVLKDDKKVPFDRFDEVNKKRKAAEEEAKELREKLAALRS